MGKRFLVVLGLVLGVAIVTLVLASRDSDDTRAADSSSTTSPPPAPATTTTTTVAMEAPLLRDIAVLGDLLVGSALSGFVWTPLERRAWSDAAFDGEVVRLDVDMVEGTSRGVLGYGTLLRTAGGRFENSFFASPDGRAWTTSESGGADLSNAVGAERYAELAEFGGELFVIGNTLLPDDGSSTLRSDHAELFVSSDGNHWSKVDAGTTFSYDEGWITGMAANQDLLLVTGCAAGSAIVSVSDDGRDWIRREGAGLPGCAEVAATPGGFLAIARDEQTGEMQRWESVDGDAWSLTALPFSGAREGDGFWSVERLLAAGDRLFLLADGNAWTSEDGGRTWFPF